MKLHSLTITRQPSYAFNANQLTGEVELIGETGSQKILLSATSVNQVLSVIRDQVERQARENAAMTKRAINEAGQETLLIEGGGHVA